MRDLRALGPDVWAYKSNDRVRVGLPDVIAAVGPYFVAIELKTKSKLSAIQAAELAAIRRTGSIAIEASPLNWPATLALIKGMLSNTLPRIDEKGRVLDPKGA